MSDEETVEIEGEVILDESVGGEPGGKRTLRVYDRERGDFEIDIPSESTVTFGYFNPAAASQKSHYDMGGRGGTTMKTTCMRVYAGRTAKTPQLAAFLGVDGFRDHTLEIRRLKQRVVIESNFEDDGEGNTDFKQKAQRALTQVNEDTLPF